MTSGVFAESERVANGGFSHWVRIPYTELTGTAGLTKTSQIVPNGGSSTGLPIGTVVRRVCAKVETAFVGCTTLKVEIGDGADPDRLLDDLSLLVINVWSINATTGGALVPHVYNTADAIDCLFTATVDNLTALTAGSLLVFLDIAKLNDFAPTLVA